MEPTIFFPAWRDLVRYSGPGPDPAILHDDPGFRALVVGLEPGGRIPPHPERSAVYHVLEGSGFMTVDGERYALTEGSHGDRPGRVIARYRGGDPPGLHRGKGGT